MTSPAWHDLDESDIRHRPPRRGTRPRTKVRPGHVDAVAARVVRVDRGRYRTLLESDQATAITAMRARELGRAQIVVGDVVHLVGDISGSQGSLARIVRVAERRSVLRRSADDNDPTERVIVAGADQLVVVSALAEPPPRPRLIDRCLVAAYDAGLETVLCLTKADLASAAELAALYQPLGVRVVSTSLPDDSVSTQLTTSDMNTADVGLGTLGGLAEIGSLLAGRVSVLVGHSGVGKSTLVNALVPGAERAIGQVNDVTGRGRHTSTQVVALPLPGGGWVIDTPGIRSFGLGLVQPQHVLAAFEDLATAAELCPRGCTHRDDSPDCALDEWVKDDLSRQARLDSFRRLMLSREERRPR